MSLNWDLSKIENYEELLVDNDDGTRSIDALTDALIMTSIATGLGKNWSLDADFAPEFYARLKLYERLHGALVLRREEGEDKPKPYWVTPEDIERRIGLHVNVSPVTRARFIKNMVGNDVDRDKDTYERKTKEAAAA